jgi:uncharacterized membrane protein SirB2
MRLFLNILAILLLLVGIVWFLQGINIIGGSSMTGQSQWAIFGGLAVVVGIVLGVIANRKKMSSPNK